MYKTTISLSVGALAASMAHADDATSWDFLAAVEVGEIVTETSYEVRKIFPAEIQNGIEAFDITGYLVPLSDDPEITDFILISDVGFCPFCGSPEHGTSLQVSMATPIAFEDGARVTLRGNLEVVTDPETFQSTTLKNASLING